MKSTQIEKSTRKSSRRPVGDILRRGQTVMLAEANAILDARARLNDSFVEAVQCILRCTGRICVTGVGKAGLIGQKLQATLASTGTLAYSLHPVDALHGDLGMIHADDVVLALSKSGSSELVELLPRLKQIGCAIILLTSKTDSVAARHADVVLDIGETQEACPLGLAPSSSTAAMLALGDAIALTVMEQKAIRPEQYASYHPGGALGRFLMKNREIMRTGANCPTIDASATLHDCFEAIRSAPLRAGAAAVVDRKGVLVGFVTQGDVFRLVTGAGGTPQTPIAEVMTHNPKRVGVEEKVTDALALMRQYKIDEVPVVDEHGKLVGMIDVQDLLARGFVSFDAS